MTDLARSSAAGPRVIAAFVVMILSLAWFADGYIRVWTVDANGISVGGESVPERDFTNLWAGGRLAAAGEVPVIFDPPAYRAQLRVWLSPALADQEWSYPPSMLLLGLPLGQLSVFMAYLIWTLGTLALLVIGLSLAGLPLRFALLALAAPGVLASVLHGQNGALTAALLVPGLMIVGHRPILAGALFGLLTLKPQLGLLLPLCLLASANWRAIASASATALGLAGLTALSFGLESWADFLTVTRPLMTAILEAPFPTGFQMNATTVFLSLRAAGADVAAAWAGQGVVSLIAAAMAVLLWRRTGLDPILRAAATLPLAFLASPYGYSYDMAALSVAVLLLVWRGRLEYWPLLALIFLWPAVVNSLNRDVFPLTPLPLIAFSALALWQALRSPAGDRKVTRHG